MFTLLQQIQQMLDERNSMMTAPCPINDEPSKEAIVLGELPAELRPLYQLQCDLADKHRMSVGALQAWHLGNMDFNPAAPDGSPELLARYQELALGHEMACTTAKAVRGLFLASLKDALPDAHHYNSISLCKNWQVVGSNEEAELKIEILSFGSHSTDFVGGSTADPISDFLNSILGRRRN